MFRLQRGVPGGDELSEEGILPELRGRASRRFRGFLADEVLEQVGHTMWIVSLPKMIGPYFVYHPELRGKLCRAAYETVKKS